MLNVSHPYISVYLLIFVLGVFENKHRLVYLLLFILVLQKCVNNYKVTNLKQRRRILQVTITSLLCGEHGEFAC